MREFDYDMISSYLDGTMSSEEARAFEEQMLQDAELKQEVELYKDVNQTLKMKLHPDENEKALRNIMQELKGEYFAEEKSQTRIVPFRSRRWMAAIAAVLVMAVMLTVWSPWKKQDLYGKYSEITMPGVVERGSATDSLFKHAVEYFNDKKFHDAIPYFEKILKADKQNAMVQYFHGIALLQSGQPDKARTTFIQLYSGSSLFKYDAAFFMGLSYLKEKNKQACKEWLNNIPADAGQYKKAQELMKEL